MQFNNSLGYKYNPNWRKSTRWRIEPNAAQPNFMQMLNQYGGTSGTYAQNAQSMVPPTAQTHAWDELVAKFMVNQETINKKHDRSFDDLQNTMQNCCKLIEAQNKGTFPAQPHPNPKGQYVVYHSAPSNSKEQIQAVTLLCSGNETQKLDLEDQVAKENGRVNGVAFAYKDGKIEVSN